MSKRIFPIVAFALTAFLAACGTQPAEQAEDHHAPAAAVAETEKMDPADVAARLEAGEEIFLLDVRNPHELTEDGMIEGAVNIPIDELESRIGEVPQDKPIVTYCKAGGRASRAASILREHGYTQPIQSGGITEWKEAGKPVVRPESD